MKFNEYKFKYTFITKNRGGCSEIVVKASTLQKAYTNAMSYICRYSKEDIEKIALEVVEE